MATMKLPTYTVWLLDPTTPDAEPTEHTITVRNGDRLRAELEGPKHLPPSMSAGAGQGAPFHLIALWCWAAAVRTGVFSGTFPQWKDAAVEIDPVKATDLPDPAEAEVFPTPPATPTASP